MSRLLRKSGITLALFWALTAVGGLCVLTSAQGLAVAPPGSTSLYPSPADRLGFGVTHGPVTRYDVAPLKAGWYYNWSLGENPSHPAGLAFAHLISVRNIDWTMIKAAVAQATQNDPGALWLIGNEPDVFTMDNVFPEVYAESYGRLYRLIKAHDPMAVVAACGIVMPTELRLQYLDMILDAYRQKFGRPMPVDAWHTHNYVLNEKRGVAPGIPPGICVPYGVMPGVNKADNMAMFQGQIVAMRQWMADRGYRDTPLVISEYGILYPQPRGFDYYRVRNFLRASFDYFLAASDPSIGYPADDNHLVQAWNWFSLDETHYAGGGLTWGALFDPATHQRTPMGDVWISYVTEKGLAVPYSDPRPVAIRLEALTEHPERSGAFLRSVVEELALSSSKGCALSHMAASFDYGPHTPRASAQDASAQDASNVELAKASNPFTSAFYGEETPVNVRVLVVNRGNAAVAAPFHVRIYAIEQGKPETLLSDQTLAGLPARFTGAATWVTTTWTLPATATWTIRAEVGDAGRSLALSRRIDVNVDHLAVAPSARPVVTPGQRIPLTITAPVANYGNVGLRDVRMEFWEGGPPDSGRLMGVITVPELPPLATENVRLAWPDVAAGSYEVWARAVLPAGAPEDDTSNDLARQQVLVASHQTQLPLMRMGPCCLTCTEQQLIRNCGFETCDLSSWQKVGYPFAWRNPDYAPDGEWYAWLGTHDNAYEELYQTVTIPARSVHANLFYSWAIPTQETCDPQGPSKEHFTVSLRDANGRTLQVLDTLGECNATYHWELTSFDARAYAGQTVQVHFEAITNEQLWTNFLIDNVRLDVCVRE